MSQKRDFQITSENFDNVICHAATSINFFCGLLVTSDLFIELYPMILLTISSTPLVLYTPVFQRTTYKSHLRHRHSIQTQINLAYLILPNLDTLHPWFHFPIHGDQGLPSALSHA